MWRAMKRSQSKSPTSAMRLSSALLAFLLSLALALPASAQLSATGTITNDDVEDPGEALTEGTTNYFVAPGVSGASNTCNGRYQTNQGGTNCPWATLAAVDAKSFTTTEDVWFLAGTTIGTGIALVNSTMVGSTPSGGTCAQRFIVGAYYNDSGTPRRGLNGLARPIVRGTSDWYNIDGSGSVTVFPVSEFSPLIGWFAPNPCYRVENLNVINSGGRGIQVGGDNVEVVGNRIERIWLTAIQVDEGTDVLVEGNEVVGASYRRNVTEAGAWGGAIQIIHSDGYTIRNNTVRETFGEGINTFTLSSPINTDGTIENNFVFDSRSVAIYVDGAQRIVVRHNIMSHSGRTNYLRGGLRNFGTSVGDETLVAPTSNIVVYGNIMAGVNGCMAHHNQDSIAGQTDIYFYANACIDAADNFQYVIPPVSNIRAWSNMYYSIDTSGLFSETELETGGTTDANYISAGNPGGDFSDAQNVYSGTTLTKMSGWLDLGDDCAIDPCTFAEAADIRAVIENGARPVAGGTWRNTGTAIASRTFPPGITHETGPANTDYDGDTCSTNDIGPFCQ
jgi:hypothetical protein